MAVKNNSSLLMQGAPKTLTPEVEKILFYRLEERRDMVVQLEAIRDRTASESAQLGAARRRYRETRDHIVQANMALVLSTANRFTSHNIDYNEMVAAGLDKLFYCVDRFDVRRGYKFSTYAVRSLWRLFQHLHTAERKHQDDRVDCDPIKIAHLTEAEPREDTEEMIDMREILETNRAELTPTELKIIKLRFGLKNGSGMTLKEVGQQFGLTKERVRQIQRDALLKLRKAMEA